MSRIVANLWNHWNRCNRWSVSTTPPSKPLKPEQKKTVDHLVAEIQKQFQPMDFQGNECGYFGFIKDRWYGHVPFFVAMLKFNRAHNRHCHALYEERQLKLAEAAAEMTTEAKKKPRVQMNDVAPKLPNFAVFPDPAYIRKHIYIDRFALKTLLLKLIDENAVDGMSGAVSMELAYWRPIWDEFFNIKPSERPKAGITFHQYIVTDGISCSLVMEREAPRTPSASTSKKGPHHNMNNSEERQRRKEQINQLQLN